VKRLKRWRLRRVGRRFVFRNEDEPERAHYRRIRDLFDDAVTEAKIVPRRTLHDIRRTVGTRLATANINQKVAAALLGHRDIATTARFYQTIDDEVIKKTVLKIRGAGTE